MPKRGVLIISVAVAASGCGSSSGVMVVGTPSPAAPIANQTSSRWLVFFVAWRSPVLSVGSGECPCW